MICRHCNGKDSECDACGGDGLATAHGRLEQMLEEFGAEFPELIERVTKLTEIAAIAGVEGFLVGMMGNIVAQLDATKDDSTYDD